MTPHSTSNPTSIFEHGRLKPGIYKIQHLQSETYLDIDVHTREVCCCPAKNLAGAGYTVQRVEPGKPEQFCTPLGKLGDGPLVVTAYPVAWSVEVVNHGQHRNFEYVRFYWGGTKWVWGPMYAFKDGMRVWSWIDEKDMPRRIWNLIPVKVEGALTPSQSLSETLGSGTLPAYDGDTTGQSSTRAQRVESEYDELGTIVNEVTVVTTNSTITTRKRYRVEDA